MGGSREAAGRVLSGALLWAVAGVCLLSGCTVVLEPLTTQCETTADCQRRGGDFAKAVCVQKVCRPDESSSRWRCLSSPEERVVPSRAVRITMRYTDPVRQDAPIQGVTARPCNRLDVSCEKPLAETLTSDAAGQVTFSLPAGFDGYLEVRSPSTVPALWYFVPPPIADTTYGIGLLTPESFTQIAKTVGQEIDPELGHTFNFAVDCKMTFGLHAPGVSFSVDRTTNATRAFYLVAGLPSTTATQTDGNGTGGFVNLAPGIATVSAKVTADSTPIGSVGVLVRRGCITYAPIAPRR